MKNCVKSTIPNTNMNKSEYCYKKVKKSTAKSKRKKFGIHILINLLRNQQQQRIKNFAFEYVQKILTSEESKYCYKKKQRREISHGLTFL